MFWPKTRERTCLPGNQKCWLGHRQRDPVRKFLGKDLLYEKSQGQVGAPKVLCDPGQVPSHP